MAGHETGDAEDGGEEVMGWKLAVVAMPWVLLVLAVVVNWNYGAQRNDPDD
jgi:hypothetical protein